MSEEKEQKQGLWVVKALPPGNPNVSFSIHPNQDYCTIEIAPGKSRLHSEEFFPQLNLELGQLLKKILDGENVATVQMSTQTPCIQLPPFTPLTSETSQEPPSPYSSGVPYSPAQPPPLLSPLHAPRSPFSLGSSFVPQSPFSLGSSFVPPSPSDIFSSSLIPQSPSESLTPTTPLTPLFDEGELEGCEKEGQTVNLVKNT